MLARSMYEVGLNLEAIARSATITRMSKNPARHADVRPVVSTFVPRIVEDDDANVRTIKRHDDGVMTDSGPRMAVTRRRLLVDGEMTDVDVALPSDNGYLLTYCSPVYTNGVKFARPAEKLQYVLQPVESRKDLDYVRAYAVANGIKPKALPKAVALDIERVMADSEEVFGF